MEMSKNASRCRPWRARNDARRGLRRDSKESSHRSAEVGLIAEPGLHSGGGEGVAAAQRADRPFEPKPCAPMGERRAEFRAGQRAEACG